MPSTKMMTIQKGRHILNICRQSLVTRHDRFLPVTALAALLLCFGLLLPDISPKTAHAQTVTGKTLIAASQNSAPKYLPPPSTRKGICGDIYDILATRMLRYGQNVTANRRPKKVKEILAELAKGNQHIFCGAGRTEAREKNYHYAKTPLYSVSNVMLVHSDHDSPTYNMEQLIQRKLRIASFQGTSSAKWLAKQGVQNIDESFTDLPTALQSVNNGKTPYFFYHDLGLEWLLKENPDHNARILPKKYLTRFHWMLMSQSLPPHVLNWLDREITWMVESGAIQNLMRAYKP